MSHLLNMSGRYLDEVGIAVHAVRVGDGVEGLGQIGGPEAAYFGLVCGHGLGDLPKTTLGLRSSVDAPIDVGPQRFAVHTAASGALDRAALLGRHLAARQLPLAKAPLVDADQIA